MNHLALSPCPPPPIPGPRTPSLVMDAAAFAAWLGAAHSGSRITYHRGHLVADREHRFDAPNAEARAALGRLAGQAMRAAERGLVHLVQLRPGDADFSYLAIRTRIPTKRRRAAFPPLKPLETR